MKRTLILISVVLLTAGSAWAEEAPAGADWSQVLADTELFAEQDSGGCQLPDLSGLSEEETEALARDAGYDVSRKAPAQVPLCPVKSSCSSILNCAVGGFCSLTDIGPCCQTSAGLQLCCVIGTIKVLQCPCVCTGMVCSLSCETSSQVRWRCA